MKTKNKITLNDLSVSHCYYCESNNFYSNDPNEIFDTFKDFYEKYHDADIDMNMPFRFDIYEPNAEYGQTNYSMKIFIMQQSHGIFKPIEINEVEENDVPQILEYLEKAWGYLREIWGPISND